MKRLVIPILGSFFLLLLSATYAEEASSTPVTATIIGFGEIDPSPGDSAVPSSDSHTGSLFEMDALHVPKFKPSDDPSRISAQIGTQFGILVQVDGGEALEIAPVRTRWTHPKFADGATVEEWPSPMNFGYGRYAGWVIEDQSEMVSGQWTVEIVYEGKTLAKKVFDVECVELSPK